MSTWSATDFFATIADLLPPIAEEGAWLHAITTQEVESALHDKFACNDDEACHFRLIAERLLLALSILDSEALQAGSWQFVSFPAALLARNVMNTLAKPGQTYFPQNYWEEGTHRPATIIEEQRILLKTLEERRIRYAPSETACQPIRVVHVAWGIVKLDGRFLLLHREDRSRPECGNYVLPGGRFQPCDWPGMSPADLPATQHPGNRLPQTALTRTLARELEEELQLRTPIHYAAQHWRDIAPWRQIEGARNHIAYTEYLISLYRLELTAAGEMAAYRAAATQPHAWFGIDDLNRQCQPDGTTSYLDALLADFGDELTPAFSALPESRPDSRASSEVEATDFPWQSATLLQGKTGKEKVLEISLNDWERGLLFALAWHGKELSFAETAGRAFYPRGWVALREDEHTAAEILARKLMAAGCPLLEIAAAHARIALQPQCIFFAPTIYRYALHPESDDPQTQRWQLRLQTEALPTPIGVTTALDKTLPITRNTARIVQAIAAGKDPESEPTIKSGDIQKTLRDQIDQPLRGWGLRKFVRIDEGSYRLNIQPVNCSGSSPLAFSK